MIPEPCKLSKAVVEERKHVRKQLDTFEYAWRMKIGWTKKDRDAGYATMVRRAHFLRMDGLPKTFPDGRPLPKASQGLLPPEKPRTGKGKARRPI